MKALAVMPRAMARRDADEAVAYYLEEGGAQAARACISALEQAYLHIGRHPSAGSLRYAHALNLPGLQCWPLTRYPQLVFYVERVGHVDVWRVLHGRRDIPDWMQAPAQV